MFFPFFVLLCATLLVCSPCPVLATFDSVNYSFAIQCAPFSVQFSGLRSSVAFPLQLTVVPFNLTPFSIPIPDSAWNTSTNAGHALTFLPLKAGTDFVASLDDANGVATGLISDVIRVGDFNDTSCLRFEHTEDPPPFTLVGQLSECKPFNVSYTAADVVAAPAIRAFIPGGDSFTVIQASSDQTSASYTMNALHGTDVALLLKNNQGQSAAAGLFSVSGSSSSNGACISASSTLTAVSAPTASTSSITSIWTTMPSTTMEDTMTHAKTLSQGDIVAIAVASGTVVVAIILAMAIWMVCARRKAQRAVPNMEQGPPTSYPPEKAVPLPAASASSPRPAPSRPATRPSWDILVQTAWPPRPRSASSKDLESGGISAVESAEIVRNPLYTNSKLWLSSPTTSGSESPRSPPERSLTAGSAHSSSMYSGTRHSSRSASPLPMPLALADLPAARRTPDLVTPPAAPKSSRGSHRVFTFSQSRSSGRPQSAGQPVSPTTTISTLDVEYMMDMAERYAPAEPVPAGISARASVSTAGIEPEPDVPPLPPWAVLPQDTYRNSAYLAGMESVNAYSALVNANGKASASTGTAAAITKTGSSAGVQVQAQAYVPAQPRVRPAALPLLTSATPQAAMLQSPASAQPRSALSATSPAYFRSPTSQVYRSPPLARVPHSPMPSPLPSPL